MPELLDHQRWGGGAGARVLVEATEWQARSAAEAALRAAGYRTLTCAGPEGSGHRCPLATSAGCGAAEDADVVVHLLRASDARNLEVLHALRTRCDRTPVVVDAPPAAAARRPEEYRGCTIVPEPGDGDALLTAVRDALAGGPPSSATIGRSDPTATRR